MDDEIWGLVPRSCHHQQHLTQAKSNACHIWFDDTSQCKAVGHMSPAWDALGLLEDALGSLAPAGGLGPEASHPSKLELRRLAASFAGLAAAKLPGSCTPIRARRECGDSSAMIMRALFGRSRIHWTVLACRLKADLQHRP